MGTAETRAKNKYNASAYDRITVVVPKGDKDQIRTYAQERGESLNAFVCRAIRETMEREGGKLVDTRAAQDAQDDGGHAGPEDLQDRETKA